MKRSGIGIPLFMLSIALLIGGAGCGPPSSDWSGTAPDEVPELSDDAIRERIDDSRVFDVPPEDGQGEPISWRFSEDEPKDVKIMERSVEGNYATIILDISTRSPPRSREPKELKGRIRTFWEIGAGWALRRWEVMHTENISMTYKKLPKPPAQDSDESSAPRSQPHAGGSFNPGSALPPGG